MTQVRLSAQAKADLRAILRSSKAQFGAEAQTRYRSLLTAAVERIAEDPSGRATADRSSLGPGVRSLHVRHARNRSRAAPVGTPVHVLFYRAVAPGLIEIVRVLHERMEPSQHVLGPMLDDLS
ncbi:MAG: type II toxin-antitoxin system RelE/ParE family toxin [Alphaproteobacteria bacterium]|nr:type II toxin-antitoxin system RelE/ParE family toxin [Alphaproteobacteria bacterium]